jgi:hypothetical protein
MERTAPECSIGFRPDQALAEIEQLVDRGMNGNESLRLGSRFKSPHDPLSNPCRLMR